ncbi:peptidoglycan DD-metalloendopeptidase family protein [Candidatus Berkelbacteria bacterium]|nr:peptidoglycan DD-metalloendopeptidase family protein [Candidatus Berkelbacteria bacterium]
MRPNWQGTNTIVALLLMVLLTNIVVARAQEDSQEFLDVEPEMAGEIIDEVAQYTPFEEDVDQAKLSTSGESEGFTPKPDFVETRKAGSSYTVQPGDTLGKIAEKYNVTVATILDVNGIKAAEIATIKAGQVLQIPPYNTSDSTAWLEETQKIARAKADARAREQAKRKLAQGRDSVGRDGGRGLEESSAQYSGDSESCGVNPAAQSLGISRGISRGHKGIDIRAHQGTPIVAARTGIVSSVGWRRGFGNTVTINEGGGRTATYAHASGFADLNPGETVQQGEVIARVGSTGFSTGPHVHYEVRQGGKVVNGMQCR